jgi:hypothetical protein
MCLPHAEKFICLWCAACLPYVVVVPVELVHSAGPEEQTPAGQHTHGTCQQDQLEQRGTWWLPPARKHLTARALYQLPAPML